MKLHGQAGSTELFELFQLLAHSQKTGVLLVKRRDELRKVQFTPQGVTLLFETEIETRLLGSILVHRGRITRTQLDKTLELQKTTRMKLGELLIQTGVSKAEEVNEALAYQLEEELFELLRWEGASFDFKEGPVEAEDPGSPGVKGIRKYRSTPLFDVGSILMEAARRADEWKRFHGVMTSSKTVLIRRTQEWLDNGEFDNPEAVRHLWDLLDGTCNLEDLMHRSAMSRFQVFESAYQLHRAGLVKLISPEELLTQAEETLVSGKTEYGLGLLAKACEGLENRPELQVQAGQLYFWAKRDEEARQILDEALHELLERGQLEVALKFLQSLHQQYPDRSFPLERLVRLYREVPDFESARQVATDLLSLYQEKRESEKLHRLLKFLSEFPVKSEQSRLSLAKLLTSFGEPQLASEQYEVLGKAAQKAGHKKEAISHYRQALHLNPSRTEAQRRLVRLTVLPRTRLRKLVKRLIAAGVLVAVTGGLAAGVHNELQSRQEWGQTRQEVRELVDARKYEEARGMCREFLGRTILTTTVEAAKQELKAVDAAENGYQARCTQKDRALWTNASRLEGTGDYETVVKAYEQVLTNAHQGSVAQKARERLNGLRARREEFERLLERAAHAEAGKDYAGAIHDYLEAAVLEPGEWNRRQLTLPVEVTSTPTKAEVWQDGKLLGHTPLVVRREPSEELTLTVKESGYLPGKLKVSGTEPSASASIGLVETRLPRWTCSLEGAVDVPLNVEGARLYVSSRAGQVAALETATGRVLWTQKVGGIRGSYLSQGVRQEQSLYVVLGDGRAMRLSSEEGKETWTRDLHALLTGTPLLGGPDDVLVVATADGNVIGLNKEKGEVKWAVHTGERTNWILSAEGGYVCVGPTSVRYLCRDGSDQRKSWTQKLNDEVSAKPAIWEGRIYLPGSNGSLTVMNVRDGSIARSQSVSDCGLASPVVSKGVLVVADVKGTVLALEAESGKKLWKTVLGEPVSSGGSCQGGTFYIGTDRGNLMALDMQSGKVEWQAVLDGPIQTPPVVSGQLCLTATRAGTVYAMSLK